MKDCDGEGEDLFFDSYDYLRTSVDSSSSEELLAENPKLEFGTFHYEFWMSEPMSIHERRDRFLRSMDFDEFVFSPSECYQETREWTYDRSDDKSDLERMRESSGAVLDPLSSTDSGVCGDSFCCTRDLDSGKKFIIHDLGQDGLPSMLKEVGSDKGMTPQEFEMFVGHSHFVQQFMEREIALPGEKHDGGLDTRKKKSRTWWRNFTMKRHPLGMCKQDVTIKNSEVPSTVRTKVQQHGKKCMEFSALYMGQEIQAHKGLIRTMKFSPSGRYLASGGEDCVIRIWQVTKVEASCQCLTANGCSKFFDNVKDGKLMPGGRSFKSAPVVIPNKVFMFEETPLHEYHGHASEILDLSWSKSEFLLTSSRDQTVRMWKVGSNGCLKVFQHNDYVTSIQFNPVDENYFISGSIDGKVRIWGVTENRVVDWVDVRDIVTAVCYQPDGKGFLVGSITGNCRFYDYSGHSMQLRTQLCVQGKKKSAGKPITGLQFCPEDSDKVMITSADSKVRVYHGADVIYKFRGLRKSKSQLSALFTSDGRYILSVGEDSHVYIWNYNEAGILSHKEVRSTRACERFFSESVSVAVPWPGLEHKGPFLSNDGIQASSQQKILEPSAWLRDLDCLSLGTRFFADGSSGMSATWPEEKLPLSLEPAPQADNNPPHDHHQYSLHHHYQCLRSLAATWSLVIVTASRDGSIRSFHNYGLPVRL